MGTANAYDGMHLVALAIEQAAVPPTAPKLREAHGEYQAEYHGLIKTTTPPSPRTTTTRSARTTTSWSRSRKGGEIVPVDRRSSGGAVAGWRVLILSALVSGLALGSMYGLLALGFHMT